MDCRYFSGEFDPLSNMFPCDIQWKGQTYNSTEAIYQAEKLRFHGYKEDNPHLIKIISSRGDRGGFTAKAIANSVCGKEVGQSWEK